MVFTMPLIAWIWGIITGINLIKESRWQKKKTIESCMPF
jgi:hypothetical protein